MIVCACAALVTASQYLNLTSMARDELLEGLLNKEHEKQCDAVGETGCKDRHAAQLPLEIEQLPRCAECGQGIWHTFGSSTESSAPSQKRARYFKQDPSGISRPPGFWELLLEFLFVPRKNVLIFLTMAILCMGKQFIVAATMAKCLGAFYK